MVSKFYVVLGDKKQAVRYYLVEQIHNPYGPPKYSGLSYKITSGEYFYGVLKFNIRYDRWVYVGGMSLEHQQYIADTIKKHQEKYYDNIVIDSESFSFSADVNDTIYFVQVIPNEGHYGVKINGEYVGDMELGDSGTTWSMENYELDTALLNDIGQKIEEHLCKGDFKP